MRRKERISIFFRIVKKKENFAWATLLAPINEYGVSHSKADQLRDRMVSVRPEIRLGGWGFDPHPGRTKDSGKLDRIIMAVPSAFLAWHSASKD